MEKITERLLSERVKTAFHTTHVKTSKPTKYTYAVAVNNTIVAKGKSWGDVLTKAMQLVPKTATTGKRGTIKDLIMGMLEARHDTETIANAIRKQFPDSRAAQSPGRHISWYRCTQLS